MSELPRIGGSSSMVPTKQAFASLGTHGIVHVLNDCTDSTHHFLIPTLLTSSYRSYFIVFYQAELHHLYCILAHCPLAYRGDLLPKELMQNAQCQPTVYLKLYSRNLSFI